ncbi:MAG: glycosyltransferase [Candidatus Nanopelagicales bacterium]
MAKSVLMVAQPTVAGVAQCVLDWSRGLAQRDWHVTVACPSDGWLAASLQAAGITTREWQSQRSPTAGIRAESRSLRSSLEQVRPDAVFLHGSKAGLIGRLVMRGRLPTAFAPHAWSFEAVTGMTQRAALTWERVAARWTATFVCVSAAERDLGRATGLRGRYVVARNGVDLTLLTNPAPGERQELRGQLGITGQAVVCVGRMCVQKGQDVLLAAWPHVAGPGRSLTLVGGGPDLEHWADRVRREDVRFLGETDRATALNWLAAADLVVLPSRWEGMALVPLESLAMGTPVVATDVNGARETVDGAVGGLVPPDDPNALALAMDQWLERSGDPALRERCRRHVEQGFDLQDTVTTIDAALLGIIGAQRG